MCGIVGAIAQKNVTPVLLEGLRRLEYRGYDSCGIAVLQEGRHRRVRSTARVSDLALQVGHIGLEGMTGIAHTRWATHGMPLIRNAHPICSSGEIAVVHNGIIENYEALRQSLSARGYVFESQTDTEVIAHLVHRCLHEDDDGDLIRAVQRALCELQGAYAIALLSRNHPELVIGACSHSPLVVGMGASGNFLASDALALVGSAERILVLEEGDVVVLSQEVVSVFGRDGRPAVRKIRELEAKTIAVELGTYEHYMQKEIFEQPSIIADAIENLQGFSPSLFGADAQAVFATTRSILILACGTSYHAGLTAKHWLESIARVPTNVEIASEYRYRDSVPDSRALVLVISQSGETADTLAALRHAQAIGHRHSLAICNVADSAIVHHAELHFLTRAGAEIGVASTKAFTAQLLALFMLAAAFAKGRGTLEEAREAALLQELRGLPAALKGALALEPQIIGWAGRLARKENALFLGRGIHYPIALEGALKLKEVSYIHAEGYAAGELKHGPLALVTDQMPVITVAPSNSLLDKLKSNMQEVRARGGELYVLSDLDSQILAAPGLQLLRLPKHGYMLSPIVQVVPLQLLAYHTARARGTDVDKPRNLAKSVTVE